MRRPHGHPDGGEADLSRPRWTESTYIADHLGAASVTHIYGQNIAAAESMTAFGYPWAFSPRDLQPVADPQFAL